jgi:hypothetical protein
MEASEILNAEFIVTPSPRHPMHDTPLHPALQPARALQKEWDMTDNRDSLVNKLLMFL